MLALLFTLTAIFIIAITPKIIELIRGMKQEKVEKLENVQVDLTPPPPVDPTEPPPPPPPPPPVMETVRFVPPVVVNKPVEDEPMLVQKEETPQIATVTNEGTGKIDDIVIPETKAAGPVETKEEVFVTVEEMPTFPGGEAKMMEYLQKNIKYPEMEREQGLSGRVFISFVVDKDGNITRIEEKRGIPGAPGLTKEAIRVIKSMPSWKAGKQNGRSVSVSIVLPVKFTLNAN